MAYGTAKRTYRLHYSQRFESDFRRHGLPRVQRRRHFRLGSAHPAPTGNDRLTPAALKRSHAVPSTTVVLPPDAPAVERPLETAAISHVAARAPASDAFGDRDRAAGTWPSAWAVAAALLLALVLVSSLSTTKSSLTQNDIARAAHHMPRDHGTEHRL